MEALEKINISDKIGAESESRSAAILTPGLVSVTFRRLSRVEIANLMCKASLSAIEWGGDVHVCGDNFTKEEAELSVKEAVEMSAGRFKNVSYGSYYRCEGNGCHTAETAEKIGAPNVRIWAGTSPSSEADPDYRRNVVANIQNLCDCCKEKNITVSTEFHGGTLTDNYKSTLQLIDEVERENFRTYWQPNQYRDEDYNTAALRAVLPYLSNVHVFTWDSKNRYPLEVGEKRWRNYIDIIKSHGGEHNMLLEFVKNDSPDQLLCDAEVLRLWLE